jgi:hypothetical protein
MYGYLVNAILIFLTHPGIILPITSPGILSAVGQVLLVWTLNAPADKAPALATAMALVYYIAFGLWAFIKARITMWGLAGKAALGR